MRKNQFLKVENSLSELEKYFTELEDRELKDREVKIKRDIWDLFHKFIIVSIDDMDKPVKNTWYDWLTNCIPQPIKRVWGVLKITLLVLDKHN